MGRSKIRGTRQDGRLLLARQGQADRTLYRMSVPAPKASPSRAIKREVFASHHPVTEAGTRTTGPTEILNLRPTDCDPEQEVQPLVCIKLCYEHSNEPASKAARLALGGKGNTGEEEHSPPMTQAARVRAAFCLGAAKQLGQITDAEEKPTSSNRSVSSPPVHTG